MSIFDKAIGGRTLKALAERTPKVGGISGGVRVGKSWAMKRSPVRVYDEKAVSLRARKRMPGVI